MSFFTFGAMKFPAQKFILLSLFCLIFLFAHAGKVYDFNAPCQQSYKEIKSLSLTNWLKIEYQANEENTVNLIPDLLNSYADFFVLFFNEDPAELKVREPHFDAYLDKLDDGPDSSPFYNYSRAIVLIQKACS